ncbi:MAG TPA: EthD family reductase [Steroidobacteraceae bacterium]|jgi:uncharacterized protein (TIGR02118 family)|nr:EthD family reductase [Steroidobacteraceae bacterium]
MITVNVLYRNTDALQFNMNYYLGTHIPLVKKLLGAALKTVMVQHGSSGGAPGSKPEFLVITQLGFDSLESYQAAFGPHAPAVMGDLPNFCSEPPSIQISDVRLG